MATGKLLSHSKAELKRGAVSATAHVSGHTLATHGLLVGAITCGLRAIDEILSNYIKQTKGHTMYKKGRKECPRDITLHCLGLQSG